MKLDDKTGRRFGRLTVIALGPKYCGRLTTWLCQCDCGGSITVPSGKLVGGNTISCGCANRDRISALNLRHGLVRGRRITPEYRAWSAAKNRCLNPRNAAFADYGGRGIAMCDEWLADYAAFLADMGDRPTDLHSLDRIDHDGPYSPSNCRWATREQQAQNTRRNVLVSSVALREHARQRDVNYLSLYKAVVTRGEHMPDAIARLRARGSRFRPHS